MFIDLLVDGWVVLMIPLPRQNELNINFIDFPFNIFLYFLSYRQYASVTAILNEEKFKNVKEIKETEQ